MRGRTRRTTASTASKTRFTTSRSLCQPSPIAGTPLLDDTVAARPSGDTPIAAARSATWSV
jgi:hypothetical protein